MNHVRLSELPENDSRTPVFAGLARATPWRGFHYFALEKEFRPRWQGPCEEGYAVLEGEVNCEWGQCQTLALAPAFIHAGAGVGHRLSARGKRALLLYLSVDMEQMEEGKEGCRVQALDRTRLRWSQAIHGGAGRLGTRHVWGPEDFKSCWTFLDHAVLDRGSSLGYHYHQALEECFVVLRGQGRMTIEDQTFAVGPGSVTWQGIGQGHGLYNPGPDELEFLRVAVAQQGRQYTTVDLHDDLTSREI
jgi:mannose-6-phosphate isomerase-like protein (cupin superfamily)